MDELLIYNRDLTADELQELGCPPGNIYNAIVPAR